LTLCRPPISSAVLLVAAGGTVAEAAATTLDGLSLGDGDDVDGDGVELSSEGQSCLAFTLTLVIGKTYAEVLEEVLGLGVDIELASLGVLGEVESGDLGDVLILALTLLLLELEGDAADGATLNALHQVGGVASNLSGDQLETIPSLTSPKLVCSRTLLRRRLEAMMAISSQTRLFTSKSRVRRG